MARFRARCGGPALSQDITKKVYRDVVKDAAKWWAIKYSKIYGELFRDKKTEAIIELG